MDETNVNLLGLRSVQFSQQRQFKAFDVEEDRWDGFNDVIK